MDTSDQEEVQKPDVSLTSAQLATLAGTSADTIRTWSNRVVGGEPIFSPGFAITDSHRDSMDRKFGEWRRFTAADVYVAALMVTMGRYGIPAHTARNLAREHGVGMMAATSMINTNVAARHPRTIPAVIALWRPANAKTWSSRTLVTLNEMARRGDVLPEMGLNIPSCLNNVRIPPDISHANEAVILIDAILIVRQVLARSHLSGLAGLFLANTIDFLSDLIVASDATIERLQAEAMERLNSSLQGVPKEVAEKFRAEVEAKLQGIQDGLDDVTS